MQYSSIVMLNMYKGEVWCSTLHSKSLTVNQVHAINPVVGSAISKATIFRYGGPILNTPGKLDRFSFALVFWPANAAVHRSSPRVQYYENLYSVDIFSSLCKLALQKSGTSQAARCLKLWGENSWILGQYFLGRLALSMVEVHFVQ